MADGGGGDGAAVVGGDEGLGAEVAPGAGDDFGEAHGDALDGLCALAGAAAQGVEAVGGGLFVEGGDGEDAGEGGVDVAGVPLGGGDLDVDLGACGGGLGGVGDGLWGWDGTVCLVHVFSPLFVTLFYACLGAVGGGAEGR